MISASGSHHAASLKREATYEAHQVLSQSQINAVRLWYRHERPRSYYNRKARKEYLHMRLNIEVLHVNGIRFQLSSGTAAPPPPM